jgi:hypothetical protein
MEIILNEGTEKEEVKAVDVNVTSLTLFKLQKEKVIDGTFLKGFMREDIDLDPISVFQGVYAAYRQANPKEYIKFEEFLEQYSLDITTDMEIYFAVISKKARKKFQENFMKKAAANSGKN